MNQWLHQSTWHGGQLLAFSALDGPTDYENALTARTSFGTPGLDIKLPGECHVRFGSDVAGAFVIAGDFLTVETREGLIRGAFLDTHHLLLEGPCTVDISSSAVDSRTSGSRLLIGSASHFEPARLDADLDSAIQARGQWLNTCEIPPRIYPTVRRALHKALSIMKTQVYSPEGCIRHRWTTPDRWPHRKMWLWDSVFHAIGWRHLDADLAREMISAVLDSQRDDGFIAHMMTPAGVSGITQPPVLAFGVKLVNQTAPDTRWLAEVYPKLAAYVRWDIANRDTDGGGLVEWAIEGDPHCRGGESGMDNSPRFDSATQLDAVDFNSFLALECETLAAFAETLGMDNQVATWKAEHQRLCRLISSKLWSEEFEFFVDYDVDKGRQSPVLASSGFLPLICGAATREQAEHLAAHLDNPSTFGTPFPVPSIAVSSSECYAKDMWRGPTWINLNWLIALGLERYGMTDRAFVLRQKTMR